MAGAAARPPGAAAAEHLYMDDEEENSADSVEQAALESANREESLLDPDSLMFEEIDDDKLETGDDELEDVGGRTKSDVDDQAAGADALVDETDSYLNTPYGSPLSDISSIAGNQKWIGEVKKMLLDDQRESQSRDTAWATPSEFEGLSTSEMIDRLDLEDLFPTNSVPVPIPDMPHFTAEEIAEDLSNQLLIKDFDILENKRRITALEKEKRDLENTLEECQKDLRVKTETATTGVEKLKQTMIEKDKSIMETSERLRKVTESYNSSEKRWKNQQEHLEKQIQILKTELEGKSNLSEEVVKVTEAAQREKEALEQKLEEAREENDFLRQKFDQEKNKIEEELKQLLGEKRNLEQVLREEIQMYKSQAKRSESIIEENVKEIENLREKLESQENEYEVLMTDFANERDMKDKALSQTCEMEVMIVQLKAKIQQLEEKEITERETYEAVTQQLHAAEQLLLEKKESEENSPVNFFTQASEASTLESWTTEKKVLEDRIAELELEKGNLLLQLVDVDEHEQQDAKDTPAYRELIEEHLSETAALKEAIQGFEQKNELLEKELDEANQRECQRIETDMNTIAWEEKFEELQKENENLSNDLQTQRKAADDLSGRYEELEKKCADLELGKPPIEGIVEIDKCDGWSDGTPQLPDEGFTEMETQISELKAAVAEKERQIDELVNVHKNVEDKLVEKNLILTQYEARIEEMTVEQTSIIEKLDESMKQIEQLSQEVEKKDTALETLQALDASATADGWADDAPVLLDDGGNYDKVEELKEELSKKNDELTVTTDKCRTLEDKLKKALKALKQKNDKLTELKQRLADNDALSNSTMEGSIVSEPVVSSVSASTTSLSPSAHAERQRELQLAEAKQVELAMAEAAIAQRDNEILKLQNELSQLATTLDSKNEEIVQLMKTCEEMQKSVDEKVGLLNDCVSKKDVEVRQAISQYEDFLKDATLNVSHLTKELEEKIRQINQLQAQLQEAQEQLLEAQNEYDSYKAETQTSMENLEDKEREVKELKKVERQLREDVHCLQVQLSDSFNSNSVMNEALDRAEGEKKQLREECVCIQNEYGNRNKELQVQISQLIDQLNEREAAVSVMETRLKESDEVSDKLSREIKEQLEEKSKALEQTEQSLFVKTEDCVRLEERIKELQEAYRGEMLQLQEQHMMSFKGLEIETSNVLKQAKNIEVQLRNDYQQLQEQYGHLQHQFNHAQQEHATLQETYRQLTGNMTQLQEIHTQLSQKHSQLQEHLIKLEEDSQTEHLIEQNNTLKTNMQDMEASLSELTLSVNKANEDVSAKNEEIKNLQAICSQYEEKSYSSAMAQESVQRTLQETQNVLAQSQQDLGTYYNELQNSKMEAEKLRQVQGELQQTIDRLNMEMNEAKTENVRHVGELQNMSNELAKYQGIETNVNRYMEDLNAATEELGKRNFEFRELEKTVSIQQMQIQSLQTNFDSTKLSLANAETLMMDKDSRISDLETEAQELRAKSERAQGLPMEKVKELYDELEEKNREISDLRFELEEGIIQEKRLKETLDRTDNEAKALRYELDVKEAQIKEMWQESNSMQDVIPVVSEVDSSVVERLRQVEKENENFERKIDLLQTKLEEVEASEVKCYEDFSKMKVLRTELEMDNLRMSAELEEYKRSAQIGDNDAKYKSVENQLLLMTKSLEGRDDHSRELLKKISQLQENYDTLRIRVNTMTMPQPFMLPPDSMEAKLLEQDRELFSLRVDLEREKKIRELYEGQLYLATSKRQFENSTKKSTSSGSWFGLGELFSSPSPPRPSPSPSTRSSTSLAPPFSQSFEQHAASIGRSVTPVTPATPATGFSPALFDYSGLSGQGPQYFVPQSLPGPSSGEGTQPAQSPSPRVPESPYANFPNKP